MAVVDQAVLSHFIATPEVPLKVLLVFDSQQDKHDFLTYTDDYPGVEVVKAFGITPSVAVMLTSSSLLVAQSIPGLQLIAQNSKAKPLLNTSLPAFELGTIWTTHGYTGQNVKVAVLDTGFDVNHQDFQGRVMLTEDFTASPTGMQDTIGHGTYVAGILCGTGKASAGTFRGVAPGCLLYMAKVIGDDGGGDVTDSIEALDWCVDNGVQVVNMSLGWGGANDDGHPINAAVNAVAALGLVVVAACGNDGLPETIKSPAAASGAIAVGSCNDNWTVSSFSSQGPTTDGRVKPDMLAPGSGVISSRATTATMLGDQYVGGKYIDSSGTSASCPHIAGLCALVLQARPGLQPAQVRQLLVQSAQPVPSTDKNIQGAGIVSADLAFSWLRQTMSLKVSTGLRAAWITFAGLQTLMQYGYIEVYSGEQPDSPNMAPTGILLGTITTGGLTFTPNSTGGGALFLNAVVPGELVSGGTWVLKGIATGTASWFRWKWNKSDPGELSTAIPRIDGGIPSDMLLVSRDITPLTTQIIEEFKIILPPQ